MTSHHIKFQLDSSKRSRVIPLLKWPQRRQRQRRHPPGLNYSPRRKVFRRGQRKTEGDFLYCKAYYKACSEERNERKMRDTRSTNVYKRTKKRTNVTIFPNRGHPGTKAHPWSTSGDTGRGGGLKREIGEMRNRKTDFPFRKSAKAFLFRCRPKKP